jgi:ADP-ribose pyrophosphatase YjhB (NUDIX family)
VLVAVRAREPFKGLIDVPGGFLKPGEDPVEGLRREVEEELGVQIETSMDDCVQAVPHRYGDEGDWLLSLGFVVRFTGEVELHPADDVAEARWVTADELEQLDFAWEHDKHLVRKALEHG